MFTEYAIPHIENVHSSQLTKVNGQDHIEDFD